MIKNPAAVWETRVQSLGWEDPLEKGKATHISILAWGNPMDRGAWWCRRNWTTSSAKSQVTGTEDRPGPSTRSSGRGRLPGGDT